MQSTNFVDQTYKEYYSDRDYEQVDLYRLTKEKYQIKMVIYPGCFVHISPSFVFPNVVFGAEELDVVGGGGGTAFGKGNDVVEMKVLG